jgi:hypothetical protein
MRLTFMFLLACASSSPAAHASSSVAASPAGLVYEADFNHQRCSPAEINCGSRKSGDPCTVEDERCVFSCATEVLVCRRKP